MRTKVKNTRWSDVQGALAVAVLETRARGSDEEIVLELPYVTSRTFRAARDFMNRVAPNVRFSLLGEDGSKAESSDTSSSTLRHRGSRGDVEKAQSAGELFTDMNQWLLKVLLLKDLKIRPSTLSELQQEAKAGATLPGLTSVHRFVETFMELGHLVRDADGFRVVRRSELMRRWLNSMEMVRDWRIPVAPFYGLGELLSSLARHSASNRATSESMTASAAMAGFGACKARGVLHAQERGVVEVHIDGRALGEVWKHGERCARRDASLLVIPSAAFAVSIYGPLTWEPSTSEKLQPVDLIQAALDVWTEPLGGKEQAMYIVEEVLGWRDG